MYHQYHQPRLTPLLHGRRRLGGGHGAVRKQVCEEPAPPIPKPRVQTYLIYIKYSISYIRFASYRLVICFKLHIAWRLYSASAGEWSHVSGTNETGGRSRDWRQEHSGRRSRRLANNVQAWRLRSLDKHRWVLSPLKSSAEHLSALSVAVLR